MGKVNRNRKESRKTLSNEHFRAIARDPWLLTIQQEPLTDESAICPRCAGVLNGAICNRASGTLCEADTVPRI